MSVLQGGLTKLVWISSLTLLTKYDRCVINVHSPCRCCVELNLWIWFVSNDSIVIVDTKPSIWY